MGLRQGLKMTQDNLFKNYRPLVRDMAFIIKTKRIKLKLTRAYVAKKQKSADAIIYNDI